MRNRIDGVVVREMDRLFRLGASAATDGELLRRFLADGDEAAFEMIVDRHGPMVRGVCGRLLRNPHDADDAFQATFLILARTGGKLRDPGRLGAWLCSVARRSALRVRDRTKRRSTEPLVEEVPVRDAPRTEWSDVAEILDDEMARLSASHRDVLALCLLGGASEQEAARRLACPVGTVKSRLSRAREALRGRLVKRGVVPSTALAAVSSVESFASSVSSELFRATMANVSAKAVISPSVMVLTQGVAPTMLSKPLLSVLAIVGSLGLLGFGASAWTDDPTKPNPQGGGQTATSQDVADRTQQDQNLRRLLLAFHQYYDEHVSFPAAAIQSEDGEPLLSWRVALLPYIGHEELYKQFRLDEPWDSPHNQTLVDRMPADYQTPVSVSPAGTTRFRTFSSPGSLYDRSPIRRSLLAGAMGADSSGMNGRIPMKKSRKAESLFVDVGPAPKFNEVHDGTSNTVLLTVAAEPVVWTKPGEIETVDASVFDHQDPRGLVVGMCDGSVAFVPSDRSRNPILLNAFVTRAGGEAAERPSYLSPDLISESAAVKVQASALQAVTAPATTPQPELSIDQRLRRVEEKIDRILEKLGADQP